MMPLFVSCKFARRSQTFRAFYAVSCTYFQYHRDIELIPFVFKTIRNLRQAAAPEGEEPEAGNVGLQFYFDWY